MKILLKGSINFIALSFFINAQAAKEIKKKPNILFIAVDDMNDWISPLGGLYGVKTPNLERLAEMSMTFTNAH
ncbi:MAG: hypothetical protein IH594_13900, partial [Bacteroidales bacterium]|nr:hypothetical protein [Bacteroidales bacterium]